jgi:CPA1 family monovalent cation:H+ antiporter
VLAAIVVLITTAVVAAFAMTSAGMPLAAAVALGAIVSPPDEGAATAMISQLKLPRSTLAVLMGESLFNDTVALFLYAAAVGFAVAGTDHVLIFSQMVLALPGALLIGIAVGRIYLAWAPFLSGTMSGVLLGFVGTFGTWVVADRLNLSPTMAVIALAMTVARHLPDRQGAHDRVFAGAVWQLAVFALNAVAFLLVGLEARAIVLREVAQANLWNALTFAGGVFVAVVVVRFVCVGIYYLIVRILSKQRGSKASRWRQSIVVAWCGMRGLVTLATALALPESFPARDLIVLSALAVVLGTLILQGLTLGPLIRRLRFPQDASFANEFSTARIALLDAAVSSLDDRADERQVLLRRTYEVDKAITESSGQQRSARALNLLRLRAIGAQRARLAELRHGGDLEDDVFRELERTLDLAELAATPAARLETN